MESYKKITFFTTRIPEVLTLLYDFRLQCVNGVKDYLSSSKMISVSTWPIFIEQF